ncbi:MAG: HlyD family efflux transporter periplasmic adaptor subunit [Actinomycetia bacterium]|nr:HlyD family efflux transporter periplasmic adaptor subunit [Actinomycetes bacterium]
MTRGGWLGLIAGAGALALAGTAGWYAYDNQHYVATDYATVTAPAAWVRAPATETVRTVVVGTGQAVGRGQTVLTVAQGSATVAVRAPIPGRIGPEPVTAGEVVTPGTPLFAVVDTDRLSVTAELPDTVVHRVHVGQRVDLTFPTDPGETVVGHVSHVGRQTLSAAAGPPLQYQPFSREIQWIPVTVTFPAQGLDLFAGESATARIHV